MPIKESQSAGEERGDLRALLGGDEVDIVGGDDRRSRINHQNLEGEAQNRGNDRDDAWTQHVSHLERSSDRSRNGAIVNSGGDTDTTSGSRRGRRVRVVNYVRSRGPT